MNPAKIGRLAMILSIPLACGLAAGVSSADFLIRVADGNRVGLTISNFGVFGNNYFTRTASLEFPYGSGYEHLVHGGLWIGAQAQDGAGSFTGVTSGVVDAAQGVSPPVLTEFTPVGTSIIVRSTNPFSPYYSTDAVSEMDLVSYYNDLLPTQAAYNPEPHRPLGVRVRQEAYTWPYDALEDVLFLHIVVRNDGQPLSNVWVGVYTELLSVDKNAYSCWPPASGCSPYGGAFSKKWLQWDDSLRMVREHYCVELPLPGGCQVQRVPPWIGLELLTPPAAGQAVTFGAWNWAPGNMAQDQDTERYAIMSAGTIANLNYFIPGSSDPVELLAVGPFASILPGDSIAVDFAFVGGDDVAQLHVNGIMAQRVFDAGYTNATTPTRLALADASAVPGRVVLRWYGAEAAGRAFQLERREPGDVWMRLAEVLADGLGLIEFEDRSVAAGRRYDYRLSWTEDGFVLHAGEASVEVPGATALRLLGVRPNPVAGDRLRAALSLPVSGSVRFTLYDLEGRVVLRRDSGPLGPGDHTVDLGDGSRLAPGVYVLEMNQSGRSLTARVAIVR